MATVIGGAGVADPDTGKAFAGIPDALAWIKSLSLSADQFRCVVDPLMNAGLVDQLPSDVNNWGIVQFRPRFKRAVVTPTWLELVYYDVDEAPSDQWKLLSAFRAAAASAGSALAIGDCGPNGPNQSAFEVAEVPEALVPQSSFTNETPDSRCGNVGPQGFRPNPCDSHGGVCAVDTSYCDACPGAAGAPPACGTGQTLRINDLCFPPNTGLCEPGLTCNQQFRCEPTFYCGLAGTPYQGR